MGLFDKIQEAVTNVANAAVTTVTAPATAIVEVATGKPVNEAAETAASHLAAAAGDVAAASTIPDHALVDAAAAIGGETGGKIAQAAVAGHVFTANLAAAVPAMVAAEGQAPSVVEVVATPLSVVLAGALGAAAEQLRGNAVPIPTLVRLALGSIFPPEVLDRARYTIGRVGITLPEAINGFQTFMGNHEHAVTVDEVMVFSQEPGQSESAVRWWAHELQHVAQYGQLGVAGFASRYVTDYQSLEGEAEAKAASLVL